jgi:hypothetical protein
MGEGEDDADAELYDPPEHPPKVPDKEPPRPIAKDGETSKPMLTRQSEDGPVFSIGDDEFGNWADDDEDDERYFLFNNINDSAEEIKAPKGKHD